MRFAALARDVAGPLGREFNRAQADPGVGGLDPFAKTLDEVFKGRGMLNELF